MAEFTRFSETILTKQDQRVVSITVKPMISDCTGRIYFTDLMVQEGDRTQPVAMEPPCTIMSVKYTLPVQSVIQSRMVMERSLPYPLGDRSVAVCEKEAIGRSLLY